MSRESVAIVTFGSLAALFVLVVAVPIEGPAGVVVFVVAVALVGILVFRFSPHGDTWDWAAELGVNPWLLVVGMLALTAMWIAFRLGVGSSP